MKRLARKTHPKKAVVGEPRARRRAGSSSSSPKQGANRTREEEEQAYDEARLLELSRAVFNGGTVELRDSLLDSDIDHVLDLAAMTALKLDPQLGELLLSVLVLRRVDRDAISLALDAIESRDRSLPRRGKRAKEELGNHIAQLWHHYRRIDPPLPTNLAEIHVARIFVYAASWCRRLGIGLSNEGLAQESALALVRGPGAWWREIAPRDENEDLAVKTLRALGVRSTDAYNWVKGSENQRAKRGKIIATSRSRTWDRQELLRRLASVIRPFMLNDPRELWPERLASLLVAAVLERHRARGDDGATAFGHATNQALPTIDQLLDRAPDRLWSYVEAELVTYATVDAVHRFMAMSPSDRDLVPLLEEIEKWHASEKAETGKVVGFLDFLARLPPRLRSIVEAKLGPMT